MRAPSSILLIDYYYSPKVTASTIWWTAILEAWAARGCSVDVVTSAGPHLPRREIINGVDVHRVGGYVSETLRQFGLGEKRRRSQRAATQSNGKALLSSIIRSIYRMTWRKVHWPDNACVWYRPARQAAMRLAQANIYEAVVTVAPPFTAHLVGLAIAKRCKQVRWVAATGNSFSFDPLPPNNQVLYRRMNTRAEGEVLRTADAFVVQNRELRARYATLYPDCARKLWFVPPLAVAPPAAKIARLQVKDKITIVYAGSLSQQLSNPSFLLKLFRELIESGLLSDAELHFLGNPANCLSLFRPYRRMLGRSLFLHGIVARDEAMKALSNATILANIGNGSPYNIPNKVFEYMALGKPILNIVRCDRDPSSGPLQNYPAVLNIKETSGAIATEDLARVASFVLEPPPLDPMVLSWLRDNYGIEKVCDSYTEIIQSVALC